jgi:DUF438 domain-containing protein
MELSPETKLGGLLKEYPFLIEYLPSLSPNYEALKNPVLRRTMLERATLKMIAERGGIEPGKLIASIEEAIKEVEAPSDERARDEKRMEVLKGIIRDLHAGVEMEILRDRFARLCEHVSPTEIAQMEQSLIDEGLAEEEVKRLCDVHVEVFKQSLDTQKPPATPAGHPVHNFMAENRATENILEEVDGITGELGMHPSPEAVAAHREALVGIVARLSEIEKHYIRKENQLFPRLEAKEMSGPSQVMWAVHDDIRAALRIAKEQAASGDSRISLTLEELSITIKDMIYKEENILYPMSIEALTHEDWLMVKDREAEVGFAWIQPLFEWPGVEEVVEEVSVKPATGGFLDLDVGKLTPEQVNLIFKNIPFDVTFVDEDDRVAYYSHGRERAFPRSPAVIGRKVQLCHPPTSVHIVERILKEFKDGSRDVADFWIASHGRFLYIRYFPIRDDEGNYRGTLEVNQNVTRIKELEGERRLLDWGND